MAAGVVSSIDKSHGIDDNWTMNNQTREVFTPEQAAEYLQVNRETIYRYIRSGKLAASKLGRNYRVHRRSLELLLWETRTSDDIPLRMYTDEEIAGFLEDDRLTSKQQAIVDAFAPRRPLASYSEDELRDLYATVAAEDVKIAEEDIEDYSG